MIRSATVLGIVLISAGMVSRAGEVAQLTEKFEAAKERALKPIQEQLVELDLTYFAELEKLSSKLQSSGNLEGVIEIRKERETLSKTGEIGDTESAILGNLRESYTNNELAIEEHLRTKTQELNEIYRAELTRLQQELTISGKIEEAIKAKNLADSLTAVEESGGGVKPVAGGPSEAPWTAPSVTPGVLEGGTFFEAVFPPGRHRLREKITIGQRDPVKHGEVYIPEGTEISCTGEGEIFIVAGQGFGYKATFTTAVIEGGLVGDWNFVSCIFDRSPMRKGDGWSGRDHASRWKFENCKINGVFFDKWRTKDIGYQVVNSTFERVEFPDLEYTVPADTAAGKEWLVMKNCRFINCDIPLSVLITTQNCIFENCDFRNDDSMPGFSADTEVEVFVQDTNSRLRDLPDKVKITIRTASEFEGSAGASF